MHDQETFNVWLIAGPAIALVMLVWLGTCIVITRQQTVRVIEVLGKYTGYREAGLSFKKPFPFGRVVDEVDLRIYELSSEIGVKTKDNAFLVIPIKAQLQVILAKIYEATYELDDPEDQITSYIENLARAHASTMTMEEIFSSKQSFEDAIEQALKAQFEKYGRKVVNVLVDEPQPSEKVRAAFDRVISSKRELEAAENEANAARTKIVGEAKAHAEGLEIRAKSYVEQRKTIIDGMKDVIGDLGPERVLSFLERIDMRDTIRDAANGPGSVVVVPMGMSDEFNIGKVVAMQRAMERTSPESGATQT